MAGSMVGKAMLTCVIEGRYGVVFKLGKLARSMDGPSTSRVFPERSEVAQPQEASC